MEKENQFIIFNLYETTFHVISSSDTDDAIDKEEEKGFGN